MLLTKNGRYTITEIFISIKTRYEYSERHMGSQVKSVMMSVSVRLPTRVRKKGVLRERAGRTAHRTDRTTARAFIHKMIVKT